MWLNRLSAERLWGPVCRCVKTLSVSGAGAQYLKRDDFKRARMSGFQVDLWCAAVVMRLQKPAGAQAPGITRFQTNKTEFRPWR